MAHTPELIVQHICHLADPGRRMAAPDGQLLDRWVLARDNAAFATVLARHGALVWRVAHNVLHRTEDAEDVFQATFLILARKAASLRTHSSIAGWLYQTAHRLALKARKASARRLRRESQCARKNIVDPLEEISVREAHLILGEEMDRLSPGYREPLLLCLYEGATQDEAARQLGCSVRTLQRRLERARNLLCRRLTRRGLAPASALALTLCLRSELPAGLIRKTIAVATQFASGKALTGTAVILAEGALRTVMLKTAATYFTLVVGLGGMAVAGFAMTWEAARSVQKEAPVPVVRAAAQAVANKEAEPRIDSNGDALPVGAVTRIGSNRFRHGGDIVSMAYTPDGKSIISSSSNGYVNCWNAATGKLRWRTLFDKNGYDRPLAVSGDGKKMGVLSGSKFAVLSIDNGKKLIEHSWPIPNSGAHFRHGAISPDLATFAFSCQDCTLRWYDAANGQEKGRIGLGNKAKNQFPSALQFSSDAKAIYAIVAGKPGVVVNDKATAQAGTMLETANALTDRCCLVLSSKRLAAVDGERLFVWDLTPAKNHLHIEKWSIRAFAGNSLSSPSSSNCGAFSADNTFFACNSGKDILLFNTASGDTEARLRGNANVVSLLFAPDGKTLASGDGASITLWDVAKREPIAPTAEPQGVRQVHFADNGKQILTFGRNLEWWDLATGQSARQLARDTEWRNDPSISPDGKLLAANGYKGVMLFDAFSGARIRTLADSKPSQGMHGVSLPDGMSFWSGVTAFSPDGTKLFSADANPRVIVWDLASGKPLHELRLPDLKKEGRFGWAAKLKASPNGRWLAVSTYANVGGEQTDIFLYDVTAGALAHRLKGTHGTALSMMFSADSSHLISQGVVRIPNSSKVQIWDVATGKELQTFQSLANRVACIATTPDSRMLAIGSFDKTLRLWEVASGKERGQILGHENNVFSVDFSPNGRLLAAASMDAPVYLWDAYAPPNLKLTSAKLLKQDREKLWQTLADTDTAIAYRAICELIAHPSEASAILEGGWKQLPRATPKQMRAWVENLNSEQFTVRKTATAELERFAAAHEGLLRDALKQAGSLEARQRLEKIVGRINPEGLRRSRILEVLEQLHTAPARRFLRTLAEQTGDAAMAREAAAGLERLER